MIRKVQHDTAERFLSEHELLGNVGLGVWHWGLFRENELCGVASYGTPCFSPSRGWLGRIADETQADVSQLCRGASAPTAPKNAGSRLVARANRLLARLRKGPQVIVAYADERFDEIGTIYQACNAIYTGLTRPKGQANYVMFGKLMSAWTIIRRYGTRDRKKLRSIDPDLEVIPLRPKHRYLMLAGPPGFRRRARRLLRSRRQPYPKRR